MFRTERKRRLKKMNRMSGTISKGFTFVSLKCHWSPVRREKDWYRKSNVPKLSNLVKDIRFADLRSSVNSKQDKPYPDKQSHC